MNMQFIIVIIVITLTMNFKNIINKYLTKYFKTEENYLKIYK